jgi:Cytochrome c554 and c-prime
MALALALAWLSSTVASVLGDHRSPRTPQAHRRADDPIVAASEDRVRSSQCVRCHEAQVRQWRASLHARSWEDRIFLAAYREEPMAFCRGCHAPLGDAAREPDALARSEGVSCASCHAESRAHLASPRTARATRDEHRGAAASERLCAGCHQFDFVVDRGADRPLWHSPTPMQDTVREWQRASRYARERGGVERDCVQCHMPSGTHATRGVEQREFLRRAVAVTVRACRSGAVWRVRATIGPTDAVGHAVPTGDLHRQLRLVVFDARGREASRVFARRFERRLEVDDRGGAFFSRVERYDGRVAPPGPEAEDTVTLELAATDARPPAWRLEHWRTDPEIARDQGLSTHEINTTLDEGQALPCDAR